MAEVIEIKHPLVKDKLTRLRDKNTPPEKFRALVKDLGSFLVIEALKDLKTKTVEIETPLTKMKSERIAELITFVPIMRAGLALLEEAHMLIPGAAVGHIGIYRDKLIKNTVEYFFRLPPTAKDSRILLLDPMLATGDTAVAAIARLKEYKVGQIDLLCLLASKPGVQRVQENYPDVRIFTLSVDPELNEKGYIIPGVGDAGDRIYGTLETEH